MIVYHYQPTYQPVVRYAAGYDLDRFDKQRATTRSKVALAATKKLYPEGTPMIAHWAHQASKEGDYGRAEQAHKSAADMHAQEARMNKHDFQKSAAHIVASRLHGDAASHNGKLKEGGA